MTASFSSTDLHTHARYGPRLFACINNFWALVHHWPYLISQSLGSSLCRFRGKLQAYLALERIAMTIARMYIEVSVYWERMDLAFFIKTPHSWASLIGSHSANPQWKCKVCDIVRIYPIGSCRLEIERWDDWLNLLNDELIDECQWVVWIKIAS